MNFELKNYLQKNKLLLNKKKNEVQAEFQSMFSDDETTEQFLTYLNYEMKKNEPIVQDLIYYALISLTENVIELEDLEN